MKMNLYEIKSGGLVTMVVANSMKEVIGTTPLEPTSIKRVETDIKLLV